MLDSGCCHDMLNSLTCLQSSPCGDRHLSSRCVVAYRPNCRQQGLVLPLQDTSTAGLALCSLSAFVVSIRRCLPALLACNCYRSIWACESPTLTTAAKCKLIVKRIDSFPHTAHTQPRLAYAMSLRDNIGS